MNINKMTVEERKVFMNAWKVSASIALLAAGSMFAGSYLATNVGVTQQQKENIQILKNVKAIADRVDAEREEKAKPVPNPAPLPYAIIVEPDKQAVVNKMAKHYRERILDYTSSAQKQMIIKCDKPNGDVYYWQSGIKRYDVNGVSYVVQDARSEYKVLQDFKAAGDKCDYEFTDKILPLQVGINALLLTGEGKPFSVDEMRIKMKGVTNPKP